MKNFKIAIILVSLAFFGILPTVNGQTQKDTLKVLFVGNSYIYFNNLPQIVSLISDSTSTKLITEKSTTGGVRLSHHWRGEHGLKTKQIIKEGGFDIVVLQEQSMGTIQAADSFLIYSKKFCDLIKESGAKPYFYATWARRKVPQHQEVISRVYGKAAKDNDAGLVLAGEAWGLARNTRADVDLYDPDGSHPSSLGTFLTACVFVSELTGEVPERLRSEYLISDINKESIRLMYHDQLDVIFCLKVAGEMVKNR